MARRLLCVNRLSALVLAVAFVVASAASLAARSAAPDACREAGHNCGQMSLAAACCCGNQTNSSTPATTPSDRVRPNDSCMTLQALPASLTTLADPEAAVATALRPHVPPHGLRFIELPILFATFLL